MADNAQGLEAELLAAFASIAQPVKSEPEPSPAEPLPRPEPAPVSDTVASPKRARTPDNDEESPPKRLKIEHDVGEWDMEAMLQNALGSFDEQFNQAAANTIGDGGAAEVPALENPFATAASPTEKLEDKIMKASSNPLYVMRVMSLPVLGNVAVQILLRLSQQPRAETEALLADGESEFAKSYQTLGEMFEPARKVFWDSSPLLSADDLDITDSEDRETIRMANLATASASIFGKNDVQLGDIHDNFHVIFIPEDGSFNESLVDLLVGLKTQAFLADLGNNGTGTQHVSETLEKYFSIASVEEFLRLRNGDGDESSSQAEEALVAAVKERRELWLNLSSEGAQKQSLSERFPFQALADDLSSYLQTNLCMVVDYAEKYGVNIPPNEDMPADDFFPANGESQSQWDALLKGEMSGQVQNGVEEGSEEPEPERETSGRSAPTTDTLELGKLIEQSLSGQNAEQKEEGQQGGAENGSEGDAFDSKDLAALIAENLKDGTQVDVDNFQSALTSSYVNFATNGNAPYLASSGPSSQPPTSPHASYAQHGVLTFSYTATGEGLPPNQTEPTQVLYDKARQAAVAKSSSTARREGLHSTRRPWSPEEERALMTGLDMVKGPHWSQILMLFGVNGTISDILKDRTQVQLKDKARNLKLFFLKTNSEMPYYLQSVTGELKTRAPSQAARKEAEEKARLTSGEEQARIQGIMTLAGGLQNKLPAQSSAASLSTPSQATSPQGPATKAPTAIISPSPLIKTEPDGPCLSLPRSLAMIQPTPMPRRESELRGSPQTPQTRTMTPMQPSPQLPAQAQAMPTPQCPSMQPQQPLAQTHHRPIQPQPPPPPQPQPQPQLQPRVRTQSPGQQTQPPQRLIQPQPSSQLSSQLSSQPPSETPSQPPQTHPPLPAASNPSPASATPPAGNDSPSRLARPLQPPNHHSAADNAQDQRLVEALRAALSAAPASGEGVPVAAAAAASGGTA